MVRLSDPFFIPFFKDLQDPAWLNEFAFDRLLVGLAQEVRSFNISRFPLVLNILRGQSG